MRFLLPLLLIAIIRRQLHILEQRKFVFPRSISTRTSAKERGKINPLCTVRVPLSENNAISLDLLFTINIKLKDPIGFVSPRRIHIIQLDDLSDTRPTSSWKSKRPSSDRVTISLINLASTFIRAEIITLRWFVSRSPCCRHYHGVN
jgi:hypothetical protein